MKRSLLIFVGLLSFVLGSVGAVIPVLPTTPLLLLSGYCLSRSSKKFNDWLINTKIYRFYAADFVSSRSIPRKKKWAIYANILLLMGFSIFMAPIIWVKIMLLGLIVFLTIMLFFVIPDKSVEAKKTI